MEAAMRNDYDLIINFSKQMYLISTSGQSFLAGLRLLETNTTQMRMKNLLTQVIAQLEQNDIIFALESTGLFDELYLDLIKAGLHSGNLDEVFLHLTNYYKQLDQSNRKLRRLLNFPIGMSLVMMVIMIILVTRILPVFSDLYAGMGAQLTGVARISLQLGYFINDYLVYFIIIVLSGVLLLLGMIRQDKVEIFKKAKALNRASNELFAVSTLVKAGVSFDQAAGIANMSKSGVIEAFSSRLEPLELSLLEMSIQNGTHEKVIEMLFDEYRQKANTRMDESLAKFELYFGTGFVVIVAIVMLSLILPLFAILSEL